MNRIDALEAEADRRRAEFAASLSKLRRKLTPLGLADAGMRKLDPQGQAVQAVGRSLGENPLPAVPLLLGLGWLALNVRKPARQPKLPRSKGKSLIASKKGMTNEDDQKAQSDQGRAQSRQNHSRKVP